MRLSGGWIAVAAAIAGGCGAADVDSDGDGVFDGDEQLLALDPDAADTDDDGLDDGQELDLGTDPLRPDTDGDRLLDGQEPDLGTDPRAADTDGDGYRDGDEVQAGHDPTDAEDRIYVGGWPYNPDKDDIADPGFTGDPVAVGETFARFVAGVDQHGQAVDLYDFGGTDRLTIVDASATWCEPCRITSSWISGGPDDYSYEVLYAPVRAALDDGRFSWVTVLTDGPLGRATADDVAWWEGGYAHPAIPVLTDPDGDVQLAMNVGETYGGQGYEYWPSFVVLDGQMEVVVRGFSWDALEYLMDALELRE